MQGFWQRYAVHQGHRGLAVHDFGLLLDGLVLNLALMQTSMGNGCPNWI